MDCFWENLRTESWINCNTLQIFSPCPRLTARASSAAASAVTYPTWNPEVPPTLLSVPSPHGTPPSTGPEKSHQFLPPLWTPAGTWIPHCKRKTHHWKKPASWGLNLNTMTNKFYWQRYINPYSVALWFSCTGNMGFPLRTLQKWIPQLVGTRQLLVSCRGTNPTGNATWNHIQLHLHPARHWQAGFLHNQAGSDRGSIEVRGPKEPTLLCWSHTALGDKMIKDYIAWLGNPSRSSLAPQSLLGICIPTSSQPLPPNRWIGMLKISEDLALISNWYGCNQGEAL